MIINHGLVEIPQAVIDLAEPIKLLNYKTTTPARFRKNLLTEDVAGELMDRIAERIAVERSRLDYVYFSAAQGAEPHTDILDPEIFTSHTFVIPVILPPGQNIIEAEGQEIVAELGQILEFNHERTHSMTVEDHSGCVVIMVAIKR